MGDSPFDWKCSGPSVVYSDPKMRAEHDGKSRKLRQLEVLERKQRETGKRPGLNLTLSRRAERLQERPASGTVAPEEDCG